MSKKKHKEDLFYSLLGDLIASVVSAAEIYVEIIHNYPVSAELLPKMKDAELQCDKQVRTIVEECTRSFITPFDREDIVAATHMMDEIVDDMEGVTARFALFAVEEMRPDVAELADLTLEGAQDLQSLVQKLPRYKDDSSALKQIAKVGKVEDKGDVAYRTALSTLFHNESDSIQIIKWKELYDKMEDALDSCESTASIIHGVIVKNA